MPELKDLVGSSLLLAVLVIVAYFLTKNAPTWEKLKLRRLDVEEKQTAAMLRFADVLENIAVDQRRSTDANKLLLRVNADATERLVDSTDALVARVERLESLAVRVLGPQGIVSADPLGDLVSRIDARATKETRRGENA